MSYWLPYFAIAVIFLTPLYLAVRAWTKDTRQYKISAAILFVLVSLFFSSCSYSRAGFVAPDKPEAQVRMWRVGHSIVMKSELSTEFYPALIAILLAVLLSRSSKPTQNTSKKTWKR